MTAVTILAAARINEKKVTRRLVRAGYTVVPHDEGRLVSRPEFPSPVTMTVGGTGDLPVDTAEVAKSLLGLAPRTGVTCRFAGPVNEAESWPVVVDIARAVAAEVPVAVLDDHAGISYLVHKVRGLIAPAEYEKLRGRASTSDVLRRLLGH